MIAPASLFRRLAAGIYDLFTIFALLLFATSLALCLNQGQSLKPYAFSFSLFLISCVIFFYTWFWTHGGQTLGMQAWRIQVVNQKTLTPLTWPIAITRFIFAFLNISFFGLGYLCSFFNPHKLSAHDFISKTRVIYISPN